MNCGGKYRALSINMSQQNIKDYTSYLMNKHLCKLSQAAPNGVSATVQDDNPASREASSKPYSYDNCALGPPATPTIWITEPLTPSTIMHHGVYEILISKKTKYQEMAIVNLGAYGRALVLDGRMQTTVNDEYLYHEAIIHMPAVLHGGRPENVLVLGGADMGAAREILKYKESLRSVTVVDIDGEAVEACKDYLAEIHQDAFRNDKVSLHVGDALHFIDNKIQQQEQEQEQGQANALDSGPLMYDIIIGDLTDPIEEGPSFDLFTREFFSSVKSCLIPDRGIFVIQGGSISLVEEPHLFARINCTLKTVFKYVVPFCSFIPTYGTPLGFCLASDNPALSSVFAEWTVDRVDKILEENILKHGGRLKAFDGQFFFGLLGAVPKSVRDAIRKETVVYTSCINNAVTN